MKALALCATLLTLSACAQMPDDIPARNPFRRYDNIDCSEVSALMAANQQRLGELRTEQRRIATTDRITTALLFLPLSAVTGADRAEDIATVRGELLALGEQQKRCPATR